MKTQVFHHVIELHGVVYSIFYNTVYVSKKRDNSNIFLIFMMPFFEHYDDAVNYLHENVPLLEKIMFPPETFSNIRARQQTKSVCFTLSCNNKKQSLVVPRKDLYLEDLLHYMTMQPKAIEWNNYVAQSLSKRLNRYILKQQAKAISIPLVQHIIENAETEEEVLWIMDSCSFEDLWKYRKVA